jgi:DNA-directed RNA polymerase subunit M
MEFCDRCEELMIPRKSGKHNILICRKCGKRRSTKEKDFKLAVTTDKKPEKIIVVEKKAQFEALPKTTAVCPACENNQAYWWMQQTRAGDEPPTRFFKCVKCSHIWREYE